MDDSRLSKPVLSMRLGNASASPVWQTEMIQQ